MSHMKCQRWAGYWLANSKQDVHCPALLSFQTNAGKLVMRCSFGLGAPEKPCQAGLHLANGLHQVGREAGEEGAWPQPKIDRS